MKVLILPAYFHPEVCASSQLTDQRYQALAERNVGMVVYAPYPTRGIDASVRKEYSHRTKETMYDGKMTVYRFPLFREGKNPLFRAFRYFLQCFRQFFYAVSHAKDFDGILVGSTPPIQGYMAGFIRVFKKIPIVYYLQDIFPDSLVGAQLATKGGLLWKIGRYVENFTYKHMSKIIVISEDFKQNILRKGVPEKKIEVIYNWVDEQAIVPVLREKNPLYEKFNISQDSFNVVYAGNLGNAQNVSLIVEAAEQLKDDSFIKFIVFGTGGEENKLKDAIQNKGLSNISMFPLQPLDQVSNVYSLGDICIVSCKKGLGGSAMPSKTWSIMSAGSPVIASFDEGELQRLLESNKCGVFAHAGDVSEFVSKIKEMSQNPDLCKAMGQNARGFILNNLTKEVGLPKYVKVVMSTFEK